MAPSLDGDGSAGDRMGRDRAGMWCRSSPSWCRGGGPQGTERGGHVVTPGLPRCCLPGARPLIPPLLILPLICSIFPKPLIFRMRLKSWEFAAFPPVQDPGHGAERGRTPGGHSRKVESKALGTGRGRRDGHGGGRGFAAIPGDSPVGILGMLRARLGVSRGRAGGLGRLGPAVPTAHVLPGALRDVRDHWKPQGHPAARQDPGRSLGGEEWLPQLRTPGESVCSPSACLSVRPPLQHIHQSLHPSIRPSVPRTHLPLHPAICPSPGAVNPAGSASPTPSCKSWGGSGGRADQHRPHHGGLGGGEHIPKHCTAPAGCSQTSPIPTSCHAWMCVPPVSPPALMPPVPSPRPRASRSWGWRENLAGEGAPSLVPGYFWLRISGEPRGFSASWSPLRVSSRGAPKTSELPSAPAVCIHPRPNPCSREDAAHPPARLVLRVIPAPKRALGHRSPAWSHPSLPSLGAESSPGAGSGHGGAGWALIPSGTASSRAVAT